MSEVHTGRAVRCGDLPRVEYCIVKFFYLVAGGLAAYRLSLLITKEDGPFRFLRKLRRLPSRTSSARQGLSCEWCMSVWISAAVATYLWWLGVFPGPEWPLQWLALSGVAVICNQQWTKESK